MFAVHTTQLVFVCQHLYRKLTNLALRMVLEIVGCYPIIFFVVCHVLIQDELVERIFHFDIIVVQFVNDILTCTNDRISVLEDWFFAVADDQLYDILEIALFVGCRFCGCNYRCFCGGSRCLFCVSSRCRRGVVEALLVLLFLLLLLDMAFANLGHFAH